MLRRLSMDDLDSAIRIHGDPAVNLHNPGGVRTPEATRALIEDWTDFWDRHGFGYWTVRLAAQPEQVLGFGGIMRKQIASFSGLNLYFRFAAHTWGKGYATEMARAALHAAFVVLTEEAVFGLTRPANIPSRRTLEKIGMRLFSEVDDVSGEAASPIYRITRDDYLQRI